MKKFSKAKKNNNISSNEQTGTDRNGQDRQDPKETDRNRQDYISDIQGVSY